MAALDGDRRAVIRIEKEREVAVLSILGELDFTQAPHLHASFSVLEAEPVLIVSLEKADYVDSAILGTLSVEIRRRSEAMVVVLPRSPRLQRVLNVTGFGQNLQTAEDRGEALARASALGTSLEHSFSARP